MSVSRPFEERFWEKVEKTDYCWFWKGTKDKQGYGRAKRDYVNYIAHRLSYEMLVGPIPEGLLLRHRCDNPSCVNPEHLLPGTPLDNMKDMQLRGRHRNTVKTHCKFGHEFTPENIYTHPVKGGRYCRRCAYEKNKAAYLARKSE